MNKNDWRYYSVGFFLDKVKVYKKAKNLNERFNLLTKEQKRMVAVSVKKYRQPVHIAVSEAYFCEQIFERRYDLKKGGDNRIICWKCLKGIESREGFQNAKPLFPDSDAICDCCGEETVDLYEIS